MSIPTTPANADITNNLSANLNYCLDPLVLEITTTTGKFIRVKYEIIYQSKTYLTEIQYGIFNNFCSLPIAESIQPYIFLSEENITKFFTDYNLDIPPAVVNFTLEILAVDYTILNTYTFSAKFHAGKSSAIPPDGTTIKRSLNFNSVLPLVYHYGTQNVDFIYREKTLTFDKQSLSAADNIFQMLFFQKWHFADGSKNKGGFSAGFSNAFATDLALKNALPFFKYEEGYFNKINSAYNILGINFPLETDVQNVIWLDENNIFQSMKLSGASETDIDYTHFINSNSVDFRQRKAGTITSPSIKINTGWILNSEINLVDSLIRSERAWLFRDDISKRIEIVCTSKKIKKYDSFRQTIDFTLDFDTND